jgi:hypothetical protein
MAPREVWDALRAAPKVVGPWTPHVHVFGCDCGSYPPGHPYRGEWSYRPTVEGDEAITATDETSRRSADASLRAMGYVLVD